MIVFFTSTQKKNVTTMSALALSLVIMQVLVNSIGALGPEISFDALWYHLPLARLYLIYHRIIFIPGGLLYYSAMPKIAEQLFSAVLAFGPENFPKILHLLFGLFSCIVLYKIARKFMSVQLAMLCIVVFYSNLVVGWESITGYIDLVRVFFEGIALYAFILWVNSTKTKWFFLSAVLIGFALATKLLALSSVGIFVLISFFILEKKMQIIEVFEYEVLYVLIAIVIPAPWFIFSYTYTGNPFYPFFSQYFTHLQSSTVTISLFNPLHALAIYWKFFLRDSDPISPIYIAVVPLLIVLGKKFSFRERILLWYTILGLILWYFVSGVEGTRIALPYIFSFSIVVGILIEKVSTNKLFSGSLILFIFITSIISIGYRSIANAKFLPMIVGKESEATFLTKYLNFSFGDWYDIDGYMKTHIKSTDMVLLYGYHNLYYVDFPYVHYSWIKKGDKFDYIATDGSKLPKRFNSWKLVYQNSKTHLHLYSDGGEVWTY